MDFQRPERPPRFVSIEVAANALGIPHEYLKRLVKLGLVGAIQPEQDPGPDGESRPIGEPMTTLWEVHDALIQLGRLNIREKVASTRPTKERSPSSPPKPAPEKAPASTT